jgi:regulator of protease activity HflC (stomatin/prohibitin superfamily)
MIRLAAGALIGLILLIFIWPFNTVPTGHRGVVTQFGKIHGIEDEGLVVLPPWQKLHVFNVRAEAAEVEAAEGSTSDLQPVKVSLTVRYSVAPDQVAKVFEQYSKDGNLDSYIATAAQESFKAVTARYTAPELISKRAAVSTDISNALRAKVQQYGALVANIDMRNFAFSPSYMAAINEKATEEQKKLAAQNQVLTVEAQQRAKVVTAEAEATALKAQADGEAYAALTRAKAEAEAMRVQNEALAKNKDVLELRRIEVELAKAQKWNGALPQAIYAGTPVPFFNPSR